MTIRILHRLATAGLLAATLAGAQTYERPAELTAQRAERDRKVAEKNQEVAASEQAYREAQRKADARKGDIQGGIAAGGAKVVLLGKVIELEKVEIAALHQLISIAEGLASDLQSKKLDEQLAKRAEEASEKLAAARQEVRRLLEEAQRDPASHQQLADAVATAEELQQAVTMFSQARTREEESVQERQRRAEDLRQEAVRARQRIRIHDARVLQAQGGMAQTMITVRLGTDELGVRAVLDAVNEATRVPDNDVIRRVLGSPPSAPSNLSVEERARQIIQQH
jgi:hypothetical protein